MLKFSGFADLTSCQGNGAETPMKAEPSTEQSSIQCAKGVLLVARKAKLTALNASRAQSSLVHKNACRLAAARTAINSMRPKMTLK